jgi:hypothetical protein
VLPDENVRVESGRFESPGSSRLFLVQDSFYVSALQPNCENLTTGMEEKEPAAMACTYYVQVQVHGTNSRCQSYAGGTVTDLNPAMTVQECSLTLTSRKNIVRN